MMTVDEICAQYKCDPALGIIMHDERVLEGCEWKGYTRIGVAKRLVFAHRLIWAIHYGEWPNGNIDHINGIKNDNRIDNLRIASKSENALNVTKPRVTNESGFLGVSKVRNKWIAKIKVAGKTYRLGRFNSPSDAHNAYVEAKRQHTSGVDHAVASDSRTSGARAI